MENMAEKPTNNEEEKHQHFLQEDEFKEKEKIPDETTVERTSDFYHTNNIPGRFEYPACFQGYGKPKQQNPLYRTASAEYGARSPTVHTVPVSFYPRSQKFTNHLGPCGMYRNRSLNTVMDKSII